MISISVREDLKLTGEKFSPGYAWIDLQILLSKGEKNLSIRGLADRWKWSKSSVARFIAHPYVKAIMGQQVGQGLGQQVGQRTSLESADCKAQRDSKLDRSWDSNRDTNTPSHAQVIDDSLSGDLVLFNIPPTHKQESKDSVCSAPKGAKKKSSVFVPPTLDEVSQYCLEADLRMDPAEFFDHFTSNGWMVGGKSKMKDWKAAARNWARNQKRFNKTPEPQVENPAYKRPPIKYIIPTDDPNYKAQ